MSYINGSKVLFAPVGTKVKVGGITQSEFDTDTKANQTELDSTNQSIEALQNSLNEKQPLLTFDNIPTQNSTNPVTSGGVYDAINYQRYFHGHYYYGTSAILQLTCDYYRITPKSGFLSLTLFVPSNSESSNFEYCSLTRINECLGLNFKNPTSNRITGIWTCRETNEYDGYGTAVQIATSGTVGFGRYHVLNSSSYGTWAMNAFSDKRIQAFHIYVEEE